MEVTSFIERMRREFLLEGDYKAYRKHVTRQLHTVRKRLEVCTPKGTKSVPTTHVSAEDIVRNPWYAQILVLSAERAWAHALTMKTGRPETQSASGPTRRHIISRLRKAVRLADALCAVHHEQGAAHSQNLGLVEATGYAGWLAGTLELNKHQGRMVQESTDRMKVWKYGLQAFAKAYIVYVSLFRSTGNSIFKDFMESEVEPSLRYTAYQYGLPRTLGTAELARTYFPRNEADIINRLEHMDTDAFKDEQVTIVKTDLRPRELPTNITWRSHESPIVDAAIGQAIAETRLAEERLRESFKVALLDSGLSPSALAASYDNVLRACQETVDTTRRVISELTNEGISESDPRMQHLRVADISVNYTLVNWRAGRNRVLAGGGRLDDGCTFNAEHFLMRKRASDGGASFSGEQESDKHVRTRLQQRLVLYDSINQSIDALQSMRGANRGDGFKQEILGKRAYFTALKCLNIGFSYELRGDEDKALALYRRAEKLSSLSKSALQNVTALNDEDASLPMTLDISRQQHHLLGRTLAKLVANRRGAVALHTLARPGSTQADNSEPLMTRLREHEGSGNANLLNVVTYPPKLEPVSVKPIYLDLAWNYVDYPGTDEAAEFNGMSKTSLPDANVEKQSKESKRRGWFEFGRS